VSRIIHIIRLLLYVQFVRLTGTNNLAFSYVGRKRPLAPLPG